ncbi:MAG TPA: helix-turn-helix transcriptional regulator [Solirubrobacterales bacterium]|nr:helix-turn-helix transcriptional regulator [Solirubrobacterales bacterium]
MRSAGEVAHHFGHNLRRLRKRAGISQEELGFRSGLHRTEVGLLERGERVPRIDTMIKVATGLGVKIECPLLDGISWAAGTVVTTPGSFAFSTPSEQHAEAMRLAAKARGGQSGGADAAGLVREVRDEMEGRDCDEDD